MIANLEPYTRYKETGVRWLGDVPEHWKLLPNRAVFSEVIERGYTDEEMLSVTITRGVIRQKDLLKDSSKKDSSNEDKSKYKLVRPGDIAYNKMRAWQGAIGVSDYQGIISPAYIVIRLRGKQNSRYFHYLFRTLSFTTEAERWSYGITSDMWSLRYEDFKQIYCIVPPLDEQNAIVRFLDHIDRRVKRYIRAKLRLIVLLNEQKQIIIHNAVTSGLNPKVRLKPSGVEWLGDVPVHWDVLALKYAFRAMDYGISEPTTADGTIPVLTMGNIIDGSVSKQVNGGVTSVDPKLLLKSGDLLFNRTNSPELVGKVGIIDNVDSKMTFASYLVRLRVNSRANADSMNYLLNSPIILDTARRFAIPSLHQSNLNPTRYGRIKVALPPIEEQAAIVKAIDAEIAPILSVISKTKEQVQKLQEYHTRLVADVVTGKLDVRNVKLPTLDEINIVDELRSSEENELMFNEDLEEDFDAED